jgi:hypothetical protein
MTSHAKRAYRRADLLMIIGYVAAAAFVMNGLWRDPVGWSLTENDQDHVFFEWVLANAARTVRAVRLRRGAPGVKRRV